MTGKGPDYIVLDDPWDDVAEKWANCPAYRQRVISWYNSIMPTRIPTVNTQFDPLRTPAMEPLFHVDPNPAGQSGYMMRFSIDITAAHLRSMGQNSMGDLMRDIQQRMASALAQRGIDILADEILNGDEVSKLVRQELMKEIRAQVKTVVAARLDEIMEEIVG